MNLSGVKWKNETILVVFTTYFVFHNAQNMPFEWLIKICDNNTNTVSFSVRFNKMISHLISDLFFILANKKN